MKTTTFPSDLSSAFRDNSGSNGALFITDPGYSSLLVEAFKVSVTSMDAAEAAYEYTDRSEGALNELQYSHRVEDLLWHVRVATDRGNEASVALDREHLKELERAQNRRLCMYQSGRIALTRAVTRAWQDVRLLRAAGKRLAEAAECFAGSDEELLTFAAVCMNNFIVAAKYANGAIASLERMRGEAMSDTTDGRGREALLKAFAQIGQPVESRSHALRSGDMMFVRGLTAGSLADLERRFDQASRRLDEAQSICSRLKENRGTLHEDQYSYRLLRHIGDTAAQSKIESRQRQLRWIHKGYHVGLRWAVQNLRSSVLELEKALPRAQEDLSRADEQDLRDAIISNLVAAEVLVREIRDRKLEAFRKEADVDPTKGAADQAFVTAFEELVRSGQLD